MMLTPEQEKALNQAVEGWTIDSIESGGNCFTFHLSRPMHNGPEIRRVVLGQSPNGGWISGILSGICEKTDPLDVQ
jgi:hypothetical protein